jgi:hypothetical protein
VFSGHGLERGRCGIGPRQQVVDLTIEMAVDDPGDDVGEIGLRLDSAELAGFDERGDDGPVLAAAVGAGEQRVLAIESDGTDCALDHVAVDLDAAVVEEAGQSRPARQRIADRFGELGLLADQVELGAQPELERVEDWPALGLAQGAALVGPAAATRLGLDRIQLGDPALMTTFMESIA